jgi:hypothetical protein
MFDLSLFERSVDFMSRSTDWGDSEFTYRDRSAACGLDARPAIGTNRAHLAMSRQRTK